MHKTGQISGQPVMLSTVMALKGLSKTFGKVVANREIDDRAWTPSAAVEWVEFPAGVKALGGSWSGNQESCPGAEASFYIFEHTWADTWKIVLVPNGDGYGAEFEMTVDYPGFDGDPVPGLHERIDQRHRRNIVAQPRRSASAENAR